MPITVFSYTDYRLFLKDWFEDKKASVPQFSYAIFATKAGFRDRGFLHNVIHGKRDLTKSSLLKVVHALEMAPAESDYFENLVFFSKTSDPEERTHFFKMMCKVRGNNAHENRLLQMRKEHFEFYSEWYHSAIRSLIGMYPFRDDYAWLAHAVEPSITISQARSSVTLLQKLGLLEKQPSGFYKITTTGITTGNEIKSLAVYHFHRKTADLAKDALEKIPGNKRNITGLTVGISEATYINICSEIDALRAKIISMSEQDACSDRTYHLNFHLFPLSKAALHPKEIV